MSRDDTSADGSSIFTRDASDLNSQGRERARAERRSIDYEGQYCPDPACAFWHGRDRFTHKLVQ